MVGLRIGIEVGEVIDGGLVTGVGMSDGCPDGDKVGLLDGVLEGGSDKSSG